MSKPWNIGIQPSEITPQAVWQERRRWMRAAAALGPLTLGLSALRPALAEDGKPNSWDEITGYNNFYEFGTGKTDPARYAGAMRLEPWALRIEGLVDRPMTLDLDGLKRIAPLEERIYRLRCVEGWSMVIPWTGYPLSRLLEKARPSAGARYVVFTTTLQPQAMRGTASRVLDWPYTEGLRLDEALHPLALLTFGVYGQDLPAQNGAPVRMVIPWKYGFKSAKSIVSIRLQAERPTSSWMKAAPHEYGFFANVNPDVPHPRWSQATERIIGAGLFAPRVPTRLFNGYAESVAALYAGMDLAKNF